MTIKVTYNVTDVYVSETLSATYINISYEAPTGAGAVWGGITGTLSNQTDLQNALNAKFDDPTGTTAQYLRGDGTLATFPTITSGTVTSVGITMPTAFTVAGSPVTSSGTLAVTGAGDTTQYIAGDGSLIAFPIAGQSGTLVREVRNITGATLTKGTVVYINGATGNKPTVAKALATSDATSAQTFGLIQADIANNSNGYLVAFGDLDGLNTSAIAEGVQLYLSATTAGEYTSVKQYAPNHLVYIGVVTRQHVNQGRIEVRIQNGFEMDELHDCSAQNPSNNDGLFYNSTNSLWENKSIPTALGYTPISGTGTAGQVAYFTGATTQGGNNNLFWDATNSRLGIGTATPAQGLSIIRTENTSSGIETQNLSTGAAANSGIIVRNSASAGQLFKLGTGYVSYKTLVASDLGFYNAGGGDISILNETSSGKIKFLSGNIASVAQMTLTANGRLLLGSTTEGTQILQVTGDTLLKGSGATSATTALTVQNSASTTILNVRNDGVLRIGNFSGLGIAIFPYTTNTTSPDVNGSNLSIFTYETTGQTLQGVLNIGGSAFSGISGTQFAVVSSKAFFPTSGTANYANLVLNPIINQTGGANGITRGLYVVPTLTAAADWRSIEWSSNTGWGLYGTGSAPSYHAGNFLIGSTNNFAKLYIGGNTISTSTQAFVFSQPNIIGAVTDFYSIYSNIVGSAAVTITNAHHFIAQQSTLSPSVITNQFGYSVGSNMIGASNNYGFYGNIASGTGRWNLYMNGTALNYINGALLLGSTTDSGEKLQVNGTAKITGNVQIGSTAPTIASGYTSVAVGNETNGGNIDLFTGATRVASWNNTSTETYFGTRSNTPLAITTNATEVARFFNNGNFRIGSNVSDAGFRLDVNGTMRVSNIASILGSSTSAYITTIRQTNTTSDVSFGLLVSAGTTANDVAFRVQNAAQNTNFFSVLGNGAATFSSSVQAGGGSTNASAILQADSTTKGFLPPRMTTTQKNAIATPAAGLMVYDTTLNQMSYYNATIWINF